MVEARRVWRGLPYVAVMRRVVIRDPAAPCALRWFSLCWLQHIDGQATEYREHITTADQMKLNNVC